MYCDQIQKRIVSAETILGNTVVQMDTKSIRESGKVVQERVLEFAPLCYHQQIQMADIK